MTNYVCSEHTTEAVTWKGTACRQCTRRKFRQSAPIDAGHGWGQLLDSHPPDRSPQRGGTR